MRSKRIQAASVVALVTLTGLTVPLNALGAEGHVPSKNDIRRIVLQYYPAAMHAPELESSFVVGLVLDKRTTVVEHTANLLHSGEHRTSVTVLFELFPNLNPDTCVGFGDGQLRKLENHHGVFVVWCQLK